MATPIILSKKRFLVQNTCPFDTVAVLIATAYTDIPNYKKFIDENENNDFLQFCQNLAVYGASHNIYKKRVTLLRKIIDVDIGITDINLIDAKCNSNHIIESYLKNTPSVIETIICSKCTSTKKFNSPAIVITIQNKFLYLDEDLKRYIKDKKSSCVDYNEITTISKQLSSHFFIETDYYCENNTFFINELPTQLDINNDR